MNRLIFLPFILLGSLAGTTDEPVSNYPKLAHVGGLDNEANFTLPGYTSVDSDLADLHYVHNSNDVFRFISLEEQNQRDGTYKLFVYFSYQSSVALGYDDSSWRACISTIYQAEKTDDEIFVDYPMQLVSRHDTLCKYEIGGGITSNTASKRRYRLYDFKVRVFNSSTLGYLHRLSNTGLNYDEPIDYVAFFESETNIEDADDESLNDVFTRYNFTLEGYSSVKSDLKEILDLEEFENNGDFSFLSLQEQYYADNSYDVFIYLKFNPFGIGYDNWVISISTILKPTEENPDIFVNYKLTLVSQYGYYLKLKVGQNDINKNTATTRRYYINDLKFKNDNSTYSSIFDYYNLGEHHWEFYFNGTNADNLESVINEYQIITITDKAIADYCYGDSLNWLWIETGKMKIGDIYNDTWFVFFNTDLDHDISSLSSVTITFKQIDFNYYNHVKSYPPQNLGRDFYDFYLHSAFSESDVVSNDFYQNNSHWINEGYIHPCVYTYQNKTITVNKGLSTVYTTEYGWFNQMQILSEDISNIIDLNNDEFKTSNDSVFAFEQYQGIYRWGVHFNDTKRQMHLGNSWHGWENLQSTMYDNIYIEGSTMSDVAILKLSYVDSNTQKTINALAVDNPSSDIDGNGADTPYDEDLPENFFDAVVHFFRDFGKWVSNFWWTLLIGIILIILIIVLLKRLFNRLSKPKEKNKVEIVLDNQDSYRYFPNARKRKKD